MRILHDDWSMWLGENISDQALEHLAGMLHYGILYSVHELLSIPSSFI